MTTKEDSLHKLLSIVTNLAGQNDTNKKLLGDQESKMRHLESTVVEQHIQIKLLKSASSNLLRTTRKLESILGDKESVDNVKEKIQLLKDYDIKNVADSQITWKKLIAAITATVILLKGIFELASHIKFK